MSDICLKNTTFKIACYDTNDRPINLTLRVGLYQREKSIFKRPTPPLYVEVSNGVKSKRAEYYELEEANDKFKLICAYWNIYEEYEKIVKEIKQTGFSHYFYNNSLDYTLDTMPLLKRGDFCSGLTPTTTSLEYNILNNQYIVFLIYCHRYDNELGHFAEQFKSVGLQLSSKDTNIAWRVTNDDVTLCRYNYIEDFENCYNNKIKVVAELYKHPNPQKFRYISIPMILTTISDQSLCSNPLFW